MPKSGRNTNGGFDMTSNPLRVVLMRAGVAAWGVGVASSVGDGDGWSVGLAEADGVGVADCRAKLAQGFGSTFAHSLCTPGASPLNGLTRVLKLPFASAVAFPAAWAGPSQYRTICWLGRN